MNLSVPFITQIKQGRHPGILEELNDFTISLPVSSEAAGQGYELPTPISNEVTEVVDGVAGVVDGVTGVVDGVTGVVDRVTGVVGGITRLVGDVAGMVGDVTGVVDGEKVITSVYFYLYVITE